MALQVPERGMLSKGLFGIARLIAETSAFQAETGLATPTIDSVMESYCHWPEAPAADVLTAPLCLITIDDGHHLIKSQHRLAQGHALCQLCLVGNPALSDARDRFTDAADRWGRIMEQMLALATERSADRLWVTGWEMDRPPMLNDPQEYPFATDDGTPLRVHIFPTAIRFQG